MIAYKWNISITSRVNRCNVNEIGIEKKTYTHTMKTAKTKQKEPTFGLASRATSAGAGAGGT